MDLKNNPFAYWAFQTNLLKEDVRDSLSSICCENLRLESPYQKTPWRIELFIIEEFEINLSITQQHEKLIPLRGWEGKNESSYLLSDSDMLVSYFSAQKFLREDFYLEKFIKEMDKKGLNYLVRNSHYGPIPSSAYNGSVAIAHNLNILMLNSIKTGIGEESNDFKSHLYGYYENSKKKEFKIIDASGLEIKI